MGDGAWEVDVPKKDCPCTCCSNTIGTSELRFTWSAAGLAKGAKNPVFHIVCAVKVGSDRKQPYDKVSRNTVRKSTGLTKTQRQELDVVLDSPGAAAAKALTQAAKTVQRADGASASKKRSQPERPVPEPPAKRAKGRAAEVTRPTGQAKAAARPDATASSRNAKAGMSKADGAKLDQKTLDFQTWSNDKMKALLKANDQSRSGNKAVLIAKCADGAAFGKLPRCPKCFGGKIKVRLPGPDGELKSMFALLGGAYGEDKEDDQKQAAVKNKKRYYCTGFFDDDEKVVCEWQADTVKRDPWVAK